MAGHTLYSFGRGSNTQFLLLKTQFHVTSRRFPNLAVGVLGCVVWRPSWVGAPQARSREVAVTRSFWGGRLYRFLQSGR